MAKAVYISQLPKEGARRNCLEAKGNTACEGLSDILVFRAVKDAIDSKIADLIHLFNE